MIDVHQLEVLSARAAVKTEQASSAINLARAGLGITLVPSNVLPPSFDGIVLAPVPAVERTLCVYTRVKPDPIAKAFLNAITDHTLVNPTERRSETS
jgi:DNA-binding transcriptional LysR family regulator